MLSTIKVKQPEERMNTYSVMFLFLLSIGGKETCRGSNLSFHFSPKKSIRPIKSLVKEISLRKENYTRTIKRPLKPTSSTEAMVKSIYTGYLKQALNYIKKRSLKLKSTKIILPPALKKIKSSTIQAEDYSPMYFQYFVRSFASVELAIVTLDNPQLYLVPLLKMAIKLYNMAKQTSGYMTIYPGVIKRRGIIPNLLEEQRQKWIIMKKQISRMHITLGGQRVLSYIIPIIDNAFKLAQQINNQPTRRGISLRYLAFMMKMTHAIVVADMQVEN